MTRHPKLRGHGLRVAQSYSPAEIARALEIAETTVRQWIRNRDLPAMTDGNPHLVLGCDLVVFLKTKRKKKEKLAPDEFRCMHCRTARKALGRMADFKATGAHLGHLTALCDLCETPMSKGVAVRDLPRLQAIFELRCTPVSGDYPVPDNAS
jgi:hypothetical protein